MNGMLRQRAFQWTWIPLVWLWAFAIVMMLAGKLT